MAEARDWRVHQNPETGEVDEQELNKALFEAGVFLRRGGGAVTMVANRAKAADLYPDSDELPTERVTTTIDIRWMARSDTRPRHEDPPPADPVRESAGDEEAADVEAELAAAGPE